MELLVELTAGEFPRERTPVVVRIPPALLPESPARVRLVRESDGASIPAQCLGTPDVTETPPPESSPSRPRPSPQPDRPAPAPAPAPHAAAASGTLSLCWILDRPLPARQTRRYRLQCFFENEPKGSTTAARPQAVRVVPAPPMLRVIQGKRTILEYAVQRAPFPDRSRAFYDRSGEIHPVFTPTGKLATDAFPPDHVHQTGIWSAWPKARYRGRAVDTWNKHRLLGRFDHRRLLLSESGPVCGRFVVERVHLVPGEPPNPSASGAPSPHAIRWQPALIDQWDVVVFATTAATVFDIATKQVPIGDDPFEVLQYHYGGMAVRCPREWSDTSRCRFLNDRGNDRRTGNLAPARWAALLGNTEAGPLTVAALCHPQNPRFPQPVRIHPHMPYFCFAITASAPITISRQRPLNNRYRFLVFDGHASSEQLQRHWHDFAHPPRVTFRRLEPATR